MLDETMINFLLNVEQRVIKRGMKYFTQNVTSFRTASYTKKYKSPFVSLWNKLMGLSCRMS